MPHLFILILIFCTACSSPEKLSVFTETVDYREKASYRIGTPDPELLCPEHGQRLHISWFVPGYTQESVIACRIRFKSLTEVKWTIPVASLRGREAYCLMNEAYLKHGGILTYKATLYQGTEVIEETQHALWTELILFKDLPEDVLDDLSEDLPDDSPVDMLENLPED